MKLRWSSAAFQEAEEIVKYFERQQPGLGGEFADVLQDSLDKIAARPEGFSLVETLPSELGYRRLRMPKFSYLIIFRQSLNLIEILALAHTSREPNYWLGRE